MEETPAIRTVIDNLKQRGWQDMAHTMLDVIEPIAPLVSQVLWVIQPMSSAIGASDVVGELAKTLNTPQGISFLREQLDDD